MVIEDSFESLNKTKDVVKVLGALKLSKDLERVARRKINAGKAKMRGRRYKGKKGILVVVNEDKGIMKGARNLQGVDIVTVDELTPELLAPGTHAGRLTLYTKSAIERIGKG